MPRYAHALTKEQKKALSVLENNYCQLFSLATDAKICTWNPMFRTNFVTASFTPIVTADLPRESHWSWNQCCRDCNRIWNPKGFFGLQSWNPREKGFPIHFPADSRIPGLQDSKPKYFIIITKTLIHFMTKVQ